MNVDIVMAEFGKTIDLDPTLASVKRYLPKARVHLYTDQEGFEQEDVVVHQVGDTVFLPSMEHYGNRCNDYYKIKGLLDSKAKVAIAMDADMKVISEKFTALLDMTLRFGACVPLNDRQLVGVDQEKGRDSDKEDCPAQGVGPAFNMSPVSFDTKNTGARGMLGRFCLEMLDKPRRGPLVMFRAAWWSGFFPCLLPPQWCVTKGWLDCGNEICLHVGHKEVAEKYG